MRRPALLALAALLSTPLLAHAASDEAPHCRYVKIADLPIRYVGADLAPAVDATIDDTPATMLVATDSHMTTLTMTGAMRRGLTLHWTGAFASGVGGTTRIYTTYIKELGIGTLKNTGRTEMPVFGETASAPAYDGILGAPSLLQMDLMLDLRAKQMKLYQPHDCQDADLFLWKENTIVVPTDGYTQKDPKPHFEVLVNGKKLDALIDSSARHSYLTRTAAERIGIDIENDPKVVRTAGSTGIGGGRARAWIAPVRTVQIGDETIKNVVLDIVDSGRRLSSDLTLGQDFLRAHRVLFATSQSKLYLAYLGGGDFTRGAGIEPWIRQEADAGNADARYALAKAYNAGNGVPRDPAQARVWMELAASQGQPNASLVVASSQMQAGQLAKAIPLLRAAIDQLPSDRFAPLWLYIARVRNGEADLARSELEASLAKQQADNWPFPIAQFYLGKWDAARLLDEAGKDKRYAHALTCQVEPYMAEWYSAHGDTAQAKSLMDSVHAHCDAPSVARNMPDQGEPGK